MHPLPTALASMGLLMLLSGCASYGERCIEQGYKSGSPEFADCIERQIEQARRYQRRYQATCLAHNVAPGTWAYADCVETVRDKGPLMLRHKHVGEHH